jgi:phospholipid transport system substrate-binding protein
MAQRSLGAHWQRRTPEEQKEFIRVFSDLLEQTYVDKIESYTNEKFIYMNERIDGRYAEVSSKMRTAKGEEFTYQLQASSRGRRLESLRPRYRKRQPHEQLPLSV